MEDHERCMECVALGHDWYEEDGVKHCRCDECDLNPANQHEEKNS